MYSGYYNYPINNPKIYPQHQGDWNDDRIYGGGFLAPFLLGGLAGAALSPGWGFGRPRPYYYNNYYFPYQPYYYRPYPRFYY